MTTLDQAREHVRVLTEIALDVLDEWGGDEKLVAAIAWGTGVLDQEDQVRLKRHPAFKVVAAELHKEETA